MKAPSRSQTLFALSLLSIASVAPTLHAQEAMDESAAFSGSAAPAPATTPAAAPAPAPAPVADGNVVADDGSPIDRHANHGFVLGLKVGGGLGLGAYGATPVLEAELGYMLPLPQPVGRSLELFMDAQYLAPGTDGSTSAKDPRLPGDGTLHYKVATQALPLTFGVLYRLPLPIEILSLYGGVGVRMHMQRITTTGTAGGATLGSNKETSTNVGAYFSAGVDFFLGPGALLAELQIGQASLDGFVMRDTNASSFNLAVGYRLML